MVSWERGFRLVFQISFSFEKIVLQWHAYLNALIRFSPYFRVSSCAFLPCVVKITNRIRGRSTLGGIARRVHKGIRNAI